MTRSELINHISEKQSMLCVGLDTDLDRIPKHLLNEEDPIFSFNKAIIDATAEYCVAYKPNTAFYEAYGLSGWRSLEKTVTYIKENYPKHFVIADAKRGDIGNTAKRYAKAFLETMNCDSITVAPYMGADSVQPFSGIPGKWVIVLGLTSNAGAEDVQKLKLESGEFVYTAVMDEVHSWFSDDELMFVVGATRPEELAVLRERYPNTFFLVPGVGAQGGSATDVIKGGMIQGDFGLLINASRGVIYASDGDDFASAAAQSAKKLRDEMKAIM
ncbi:MAG: orotidine-5'-phosphate decarboxylase [Flavobacteriia bacterium]|nr:orotidine-5'-phosphate decarboxylase [Flavobacteriia bacterium]